MSSRRPPSGGRKRGQKRWGLRTLAFLVLAAGSVLLSNYMRLSGNTGLILLPSLGLVAGLIGAAVCTALGIRAWGGRIPRP